MVVKVIQGHSRCVWGRVHTFIFAAKCTMIVQISFWKEIHFMKTVCIFGNFSILDVHFIICMVWHVDWCLIWILDVAITKIFRIFFWKCFATVTHGTFSPIFISVSQTWSYILWMTTTNTEISAKIFFDVQSLIFLALWKY